MRQFYVQRIFRRRSPNFKLLSCACLLILIYVLFLRCLKFGAFYRATEVCLQISHLRIARAISYVRLVYLAHFTEQRKSAFKSHTFVLQEPFPTFGSFTWRILPSNGSLPSNLTPSYCKSHFLRSARLPVV